VIIFARGMLTAHQCFSCIIVFCYTHIYIYIYIYIKLCPKCGGGIASLDSLLYQYVGLRCTLSDSHCVHCVLKPRPTSNRAKVLLLDSWKLWNSFIMSVASFYAFIAHVFIWNLLRLLCDLVTHLIYPKLLRSKNCFIAFVHQDVIIAVT